jgi:hypothetical protein
MSKQIIDIGNQSNDGTGDSIRDAFKKANDNFDELYSLSGLGGGLYFTKNLVDTPKTLIADTVTNAVSLIGVNTSGTSLTNRLLVAGVGMAITKIGTSVFITNTASTLSTDKTPTLGGNLSGTSSYRAVSFVDPQDPQDLTTKIYVDLRTVTGKANLYVSTAGRDDIDVLFGNPSEIFPLTGQPGLGGRSIAYAFRTISKACQIAQQLVEKSDLELGPDQKFITYSNSATISTITTITNSSIVAGNKVISVPYTGVGTNPWIQNDIRPGQYIRGMTSGAVGFINYLSNQGNTSTIASESYDVRVIVQTPPKAFQQGEQLMYGTPVVTSNVTIIVESGIYEEHYPLKVPANTSIRGDEFRRVLVRPRPGTSQSPWVRTYFYRDSVFDGLTVASTGTLNARGSGYYGHHYLTDPTNRNSTPKQNNEIDVFLMNDQTILRAFSAQGHGGFMMVLDPEGQILTKSPYVQNCSSISRSLNTQTFAGGMYIDGCAGNLPAQPTNTTTYFVGTTTISVTGLSVRQPQVPCTFIVNGIGYEIDYVGGWSSSTTTATLYLNPNNPGGIGSIGGVIAVNSGTGYSLPPVIQFSAPQGANGVVAQGTATVAGGVVTQINITNPGSGYTAPPTVTFIPTGGGNGATVAISSSTVVRGYIGRLPSSIEIGTAGYRSSLAADFTQLNDLGYGVVITNLGFAELVSVFAYFCHVGYYANNGGQIGSSNGAIKYGTYATVASGADPNEVPFPIRLLNNMVDTAIVDSNLNNFGLNTVNTTTDSILYVRGWNYIPYNQSVLTIDHTPAVDVAGNPIGVRQYTITSANTVTNTATILQLNLSSSFGAGALRAPVPNGTRVLIRGNRSFGFSGVNIDTITRPSTALSFNENLPNSFQVLTYNTATYPNNPGYADVTLKKPFEYIQLTPSSTASVGATTITIFAPSTATSITSLSDRQRLTNSVAAAGTSTDYIFGWNDTVHWISGFNIVGNNTTATITIAPPLSAAITNTNTVLYAGLQRFNPAEVTARISVLRATGQDFVDIGTGGRETSNIPNDIFGPPRIKRDAKNQVIQIGKGRVFITATDQDGNFRVGDLFEINQGTGSATLAAAITLQNVDGLSFNKGVLADEFSTDDAMNPPSNTKIPTQKAVADHLNRRLGVTIAGTTVTNKLGSGYLDLTGIQAMTGALTLSGAPTQANHATTKSYVDTQATGYLLLTGGTLTGNLNFDNNSDINFNATNTGSRILGNFGDPIEGNRPAFQSNSANTGTGVNIIPNGSGTFAGITAYSSSDANNASYINVWQRGTTSFIDASKTGTGIFGDLVFETSDLERLRITAGGSIRLNNIAAGATTANTGTISGQWTLVAGSTLNATYADLAENYTSDAEYAPGTVVVFGGEKEITISTQPMDRRVAGVISTNPAYTMNIDTAGATVALQGRVPCNVVGTIHKGDMLVSSGIPGVATAEYNPKMGTVIGKALEYYSSTEVGTIEVVVGRL